MVDFMAPSQRLENQPVGADGLAREGNLDILASWHQLGCLAAGLAPPPHPILAPALPLSCFGGVFGYQNIDILVALAP